MQRDGLLLHLYAGEDSGFTFGKAWKQCTGEERILLEVDVKRGSQHDMIPDDGIYASLITAAIQGKILGILDVILHLGLSEHGKERSMGRKI